ncbi:MAG: hypothetical protein AAF352_00295, partial [Pseudomonadota bacterium]
MPYVSRDASGKIIAISKVEEQNFREFLADDNAEMQNFIQSSAPRMLIQLLRASDIKMLGKLEELIAILIEKRLLNFTDFSP